MIAAGKTIQSPRARYLVQSERGRGGFGVAWRATRQVDGKAVVLKELRLDRLENWKAMQLFEREARVMEELSHPGIPAYIEFFGLDPDGVAFDLNAPEPRDSFTTVLVQEFIVGDNLDERRRAGKRYTSEELTKLTRSMLIVLMYLHELSPPVIHRDITPQNIVRDPDGEFYLVDFGAIQDRLRSGTMLGSTNVGTFGFIPPEQAMGHTKPASDLYALAMTVVVVATGRMPEHLPLDESTAKIALGEFDGCWSARLRDTLDQMLEPIVGKRVSSARDALRLLASPPAGALVTTGGGGHRTTLGVGRTVQIGRAENVDIRVADPSVSRYHASIAHRTDGGFVVRDLGSARGTAINGRPAAETPVTHGDELRLGLAHFGVAIDGETITLHELGRVEGNELVRGGSSELVVHSAKQGVILVVVVGAFMLVMMAFALLLVL